MFIFEQIHKMYKIMNLKVKLVPPSEILKLSVAQLRISSE